MLTRTGKPVHTSPEGLRAWKAANRAAGNCHDCTAPRLHGKSRCQKCLDRHCVTSSIRRTKRLFFGLDATTANTLTPGVDAMVGVEDQSATGPK